MKKFSMNKLQACQIDWSISTKFVVENPHETGLNMKYLEAGFIDAA